MSPSPSPSTCTRPLSTTPPTSSNLRIGFVPEHFSTPLHFAQKHHALSATLIPFPSGTGHMVTSLRAGEIDIGIGLTEGWIAALGKSQEDAGFKLVGTYVETPLCWAISTGARRDDIQSIEDLRGKKVGVSRIGSGSYVMSFVLAEQQGWLSSSSSSSSNTQQPSTQSPFPVQVLQTFKNLRDGVNKIREGEAEADFFMWEHFTSNRYYSTNEIKRVGEIYTPWPSWHIVASTSLLFPSTSSSTSSTSPDLETFLRKLNAGISYFNAHPSEAIAYISTHLDYSAADAEAWLQTVRFARDVRGVDWCVVGKTVGILQTAGVLGRGVDVDGMVAVGKGEGEV
ncbi:hypothetical protein K491DRAFT_611836 [Lophiostoma macrostomum CBS 122681]|uniref:Ca3427-like PBP 2 domain-containing protein n=1 Tax=Lophiostoma macrostomum CBS 122681 TaxID=1314788 RepID=A0A6A6SLV0_9PLEO|nr:hypothetical protein K491DRAFT_611836 [Lophiostoma macrostomum CBS 122681]